MLQEVKDLQQSVENLVERFAIKYYSEEGEDVEYYFVWDMQFDISTVNIVDDYWNIDDIYLALKEDISEDVLFERYHFKTMVYTINSNVWKDVEQRTNLNSWNMWHRKSKEEMLILEWKEKLSWEIRNK